MAVKYAKWKVLLCVDGGYEKKLRLIIWQIGLEYFVSFLVERTSVVGSVLLVRTVRDWGWTVLVINVGGSRKVVSNS